ncbi:MAG TPA: hypothetical protein VH253_10495 [Phycisphaerae bacterium]|nr:hypothetical protein [Phycisphaerae bacterium]
MALLDTTVFLDLGGKHGRRYRAPAEAMIRQLLAGGETLMSSRVNLAELYVGVELADDPAREEGCMSVLAP